MARGDAQAWSAALAADGQVEVGLGKRRLVLLLLASIVFVVAGLGMAGGGSTTVTRVFGWVAVVFFGFGLVYFVRQLFRRGPALVVDRRGISTPYTDTTIPWSAARSAGVFESHGTKLIQVEADTEFLDAFYEEHRAAAVARGANRKLLGGVEALSLPSPLAVDSDAFAAWLDEEIRRRS